MARLHLASMLLPLLLLASALVQPAFAQEDGVWFKVDEINPGLGPVPDDLDRSTPHGLMETFVDSIRIGDHDAAAHLLDLRDIGEDDVPGRGADLARKLGEVVQRQVVVDWLSLPDRPDALLETAPSDDPMAGRERRSLRLDILDIAGRPVPVRIARLKPENGPPVWLFSRHTVANIPMLHRKYGPGWFEQRLPESWRAESGLGVRVWEMVALPVLAALCIGVFFLVRSLVGRLAARAAKGLLSEALRAARTPLALFLAAGLLRWTTTSLLSFSSPITSVLSPLLIAAMVISITMAVLRAIDTALDFITERFVGDIDDAQSSDERHFYTSIYAARRLVLVIAVIAGAGLILSQLHLFETLGISLLASAGVVAVVISIAGQSVLGNIMASLQIAFSKPVRIGDSVSYEGDWAHVEAIFYTHVRLKTWDGRRLIVPVRYLISKPFENWTMTDARMTRTFDLLLDHQAEVKALRAAFLEQAKADEDVMPDEILKVLAMGHDHNGIRVRFYATAEDPSTAFDMHARLRESMLDWVRENHPEWWPQERVREPKGLASTAGAVGDPGG